MNIGPAELIIVLMILLLVFGGSKLPGLARSMGEAVRALRSGVHDDSESETS